MRELQAKLAETVTTAWPVDGPGVTLAFDCLDYGIAVWSAELTLQYWNRQYAEFYLGGSDKLYVGKPLSELLRGIAEEGGLGDGDVDELVERRLEEFLGKERLITLIGHPEAREIEVRRQLIPGGSHVVTLRDVTERRRAERQLQRQAVVMEQLREAVIVTAIDRKVVDINPVAAQMLGYSRTELIGQTPDFYTAEPENWKKKLPAIFDEMLKKGVWKGEVPLRRKDGTPFVSELVLAPLRDDTGVQIATIAMHRDITEQRRIEKELQRQAVVMEQLNEAVVISDLDHRVTDANQAAERLFGYSRDELVSQTTAILPADPAAWEQSAPKVLARLRKGKSWKGETFMRHKDGSDFLADLALAPLRDTDGSAVATIAVIRDVTSRRQAEEALKASERKFFMLFETIGDGIVLTDNDGFIEDANQAFLDMVGYARDEIIGMDPRRLMPERFHMQRDDSVREAYESGRMVTVEKEYLRKNGTTFPAIANLAVIFDDDGTPLRRTTIVRDITEQREKEREQKRLMAILEATTDFIGIVTRNGGLAYLNQAGRRMLGLGANADVSRWSIWDFHTDACARQIKQVGLPAVERDGAWHGEASLVNRKGEEIPVSQLIVAHRGRDGEIEYYSSMARDISDRVAFEAELMKAKEWAEIANRAKSDFLANMSHELRTPLNAIIGFSKMMKDQLFGDLGAPQYVEYVNDINDSGTHLLGIINDILDLSKIEAGKYELSEQEVDLAAMVTWCANTIRPRLHSGRQKLTLTLSDHVPRLWADERALRQILLNLLSNSVKFTPEDGEITVEITEDEDGGVTLRVVDTGVGIPEDKIEDVLQPFGQADSTLARQFGGTGLGLSITKSLLDMHGADLKLTSTEGKGTTATVRFPAARRLKAS